MGDRYKDDKAFKHLVEMSENAYHNEWEDTQHKSHEEISAAAQEAGLGNANQFLNDALADIAARIIRQLLDWPVNILDIGAGSGATTKAIWEKLSPNIRERTFWTLLDPASQALQEAKEMLLESGMDQKQLTMLPKRDLDALPDYQNHFMVPTRSTLTYLVRSGLPCLIG